MKSTRDKVFVLGFCFNSLARCIIKEFVSYKVEQMRTAEVQKIKTNPGPRDRWSKVK